MACIALSPLSSVLWKNYVAVLLFMTHTHKYPFLNFLLSFTHWHQFAFFLHLIALANANCETGDLCHQWDQYLTGSNSGYRASENMSARNKVENEVEKYRCDMWLEWWPDLTELFPLAPPCSQLVPPGQLKSAPRGLGPLMLVNPCENDDISVHWANRNHSNHSDPTQYCSVGWKKEWHGTGFAPDKYNVSSNRCKVC